MRDTRRIQHGASSSPVTKLGASVALAFLMVAVSALAGHAQAVDASKRELGQMLFASGSPRSGQNLFTMNADGTDQKQLTTLGNLQSADPCCISPNKRKIVFTLVDGNSFPAIAQVYVVNSDGTGLTNLSKNTDAQYSAEDLSPNGKRILIQAANFSTPGSPQFTIQSMKPDGSHAKTLAHGSGPARYSPNGRKILFVGQNGISVMNADGSHQKPVTLGLDTQPSWSPNGKTIAFIRIVTVTVQGFQIPVGLDLYTVDADGKNLTDVTHDSEQQVLDLNPAFAPSGNSIVFTRAGAAGKNVFNWILKNKTLTQLTKDNASENPLQLPTFDPSGENVFYTSTAAGGNRIFSVGLDGENPELLVSDGFLL